MSIIFLDGLDKDIELNLCSVILTNGLELFCRIAQYDKTTYVMEDPLIVMKEDIHSENLYFEKYNPYSDDLHVFIKEYNIQSVSNLSDNLSEVFETAVNGLNSDEEHTPTHYPPDASQLH